MNKKTKFKEAEENGYFSGIMNSYYTKKDITYAPNRALLYSYHPSAEKPIVFRHYTHMLDDVRSFKYPKKIHRDCYTVYVFFRQNVHLIINDETYAPQQGNIVILRKHSVFVPVFFSVEYFDYYEINIPEEYFDLTPFSSPLHSMFLKKENETHVFITPSKESQDEIFHILSKIDHIIEQNNKHMDFLVYSYLIRMFAFIDNNVVAEFENTKKLKSSPTIRKAIEYINENYLTISQVEEVATHCHISVSYLCRIFRKQLGISPTEFINFRKITHAKHLLKKEISVTDVCFASGFNSYNHFISLFKKITGQTPVKYRKTEKYYDDDKM